MEPMSDEEILAKYRARNPYISLGEATELHRTWLRFQHLGTQKQASDRKAREDDQRRLDRLCEQKRHRDSRA
jgi:hypothetical protein